jgi:hypothetical protein
MKVKGKLIMRRARGFIYIWTNNVDGKKYLGKCWGEPASSYKGSGKYFRRALAKYGIENFDREILEFCYSKEDLRNQEQYWLDYYQAADSDMFYNISPNAGGGHHSADYNGEKNPMYGRKHPNHKVRRGTESNWYGLRRAGSKNPNAKKYLIVDPDGNEYHTICLKEFVVENFTANVLNVYQSLKEQAIRNTFKPARIGHCKGWKIKHDLSDSQFK